MIIEDEQFLALYNFLTSEEILGPGPDLGRVTCDHTLRWTIDWMKNHQVPDMRETLEKIVDLGGYCDCEVLFNVDPDTWAEQRDEEIAGPDRIGEEKWQQFLSDLLARSGMETS